MYLCIDIGGTKTLVALVSAQGKILHSIQFATIADQTKFYDALSQQIRVNFALSDVVALGVAMPGIVEKNRATWLGNLPWHNFDLANLLLTDFKLPVFIENDANLAALAEAQHLKGRSLYLTFSTGIGGGVIDDGRFSAEYPQLEPGHTKYRYAGQTAEWEDLAAASAIRSLYNQSVTELTDRAQLQEISTRIALGLAPLIKQLQPARIIFGGPLGLRLPSYRRILRRQLVSKLANQTLPRLQIARYGSFSVIQGCYLYAKAQLTRR